MRGREKGEDMHSRFRFYALIALIGLANSAVAQERREPEKADTPPALSRPTPGKHQLKPTPMQVLEHLIVQQNQQITEQKEQIEALAGKIDAQEKQFAALLTKVETSHAQIDSLSGQLIQITELLEEVRKGVIARGGPVAAPSGADPLDETAEVTTARISAQVSADATPIPVRTPAAGEEPVEPGGRVHVISQGETLTTIARQYDTTVAELTRLNKIKDPRKLQVGQSLFIP